MFCPDCGAENSRGQKFCTRCGGNLLAIERAREIVADVAQASTQPALSPNVILGIIALICVVGFTATTIGTLVLASNHDVHGPMPFFFALLGFGSLVFICRYLFKLLQPSARPQASFARPISYAVPTPPRQEPMIDTNRALGQGAPNYQSVVEDPTLQFDRQRRGQ